MVVALDFAFSSNPHQQHKPRQARNTSFNPPLPQEHSRKGITRTPADMSSDLRDLRMQILNNTKYMMHSSINKDQQADTGTKLPTLGSVATLVTPSTTTASTSSATPENQEVVVYGDGSEFKAAVVSGIYPVIEGAAAATPEGAMRKLLMSTSELLNTMMPKLGSHQRNIHGGGVVDEDFISRDLLDKKV